MMKNQCRGKDPFFTKAEADAACESLKRDAQKTGEGGKSWRRLNVYACGNHFHIGRSDSYLPKKPATPMKKIPSLGQLRRKLQRIDQKMDGERRHRAFVWGQVIQAQALAEEAADIRRREEALRFIGY
jgi:hypothetical protein